MRIVLLGANGQIGSYVMSQLLHDYPEAEVVGTVRAESMAGVRGKRNHLQNLISFSPFTDNWQKLGKADVLINCIGIIQETATFTFDSAHRGLTALMLQHRQLLGWPKIIQLSALGASSTSGSRFLQTKGEADQELLGHSQTVVVRPSIVCTPNTMLSKKLQLVKKLCQYSGGILPFPENLLQTKLQPVEVADVTLLLSRLCVEQAHQPILEAGGRDVFTVRELLEMVPTCQRIVAVPSGVSKVLFAIVAKLLPQLLSKEQQVLLQTDNITNATDAAETIIGRKMLSTRSFWQQELDSKI